MQKTEPSYKVLRTSKKFLLLFFILSSLPVSFIFCILFIMNDSENITAFAIVYHIVIFLIFLETIRRYFNYKYVFTTSRVIDIEGIASTHLTQNIIDYIDIREVKINQSVLGRMAGYADLLISTASTSGIEVNIKNIEEATEIYQYINKRKIELITLDNQKTDSPN